MIPVSDILVSILLPVRNGEATIESVVRTVLEQKHENIEVLIADNASTDGTGDVCRDLAMGDHRVVYHRHPENIGLMGNFVWCARQASGTYFRWIGHDDWIAPDYVGRCLDRYVEDERLILVTTQIEYVHVDGSRLTAPYSSVALGSSDPVVRMLEMLRLQTESYLLLDPMYGMLRREAALSVPLRPTLRGDDVYSLKLALAGPWGHVPEVLAMRHWEFESRRHLAAKINVPAVHAGLGTLEKFGEMARWLTVADLTANQRRRARRVLPVAYARHHWRNVATRADRVFEKALDLAS